MQPIFRNDKPYDLLVASPNGAGRTVPTGHYVAGDYFEDEWRQAHQLTRLPPDTVVPEGLLVCTYNKVEIERIAITRLQPPPLPASPPPVPSRTVTPVAVGQAPPDATIAKAQAAADAINEGSEAPDGVSEAPGGLQDPPDIDDDVMDVPDPVAPKAVPIPKAPHIRPEDRVSNDIGTTLQNAMQATTNKPELPPLSSIKTMSNDDIRKIAATMGLSLLGSRSDLLKAITENYPKE